MRAILRGGPFLPTMVGLVALAWATLWLWERSPFGRYLHHGGLPDLDTAGIGDAALQAGLYVGGWVLMTVAMMLPTTLPLLAVFRQVTGRRDDRGRLLALVITGYLGVWLVFGVAAHLFDWGVHLAIERIGWLQANPWALGAGVLLAAGAFQFSSLKYHCLDKCRAPRSFVMRHWQGRAERRRSLLLGIHHGAFCVGCCWALMLLMFAVGTGNVGWMLVLAAVMAAEKNVPRGRVLAKPLGVALIAWGVLVAMDPSWSF